ncbi:hypothetical protein DFJ67_2752 [Asanoa ferruginea]|uniref:Uncharacterized protein n=1 Tax=Asanoa ferruginea TaxID=53367 RepID=A0A3D9ZHM8_9ACTN|nr:hypothetical protein [Asanoa ferruginea]REF96761.1 hypothetical protein DFJ67_2752 [Asanoa ferruginea]GIF53383.1 hypothetical protein Afe04nite_79220 [Asanoa ferruginea]
MTAAVDEDVTTRDLTSRNLAQVRSGVNGVQLTPKKILALMLGIGLPVVISAGWALGQRGPTETAEGGAGAMGTAPEEQVPSPAAQQDVYDDGPVVVPMVSTAATATPTPSAEAKTSPGPHPTTGATPLPEDETPSPEPSPSDPEPTVEPSVPATDR